MQPALAAAAAPEVKGAAEAATAPKPTGGRILLATRGRLSLFRFGLQENQVAQTRNCTFCSCGTWRFLIGDARRRGCRNRSGGPEILRSRNARGQRCRGARAFVLCHGTPRRRHDSRRCPGLQSGCGRARGPVTGTIVAHRSRETSVRKGLPAFAVTDQLACLSLSGREDLAVHSKPPVSRAS